MLIARWTMGHQQITPDLIPTISISTLNLLSEDTLCLHRLNATLQGRRMRLREPFCAHARSLVHLHGIFGTAQKQRRKILPSRKQCTQWVRALTIPGKVPDT